MNILIEGWRGINHSFSLVNQWQIIELLKTSNIYFKDVPFISDLWNKKDNSSGFENNIENLINKIPEANPNQDIDITYRISCPFDLVKTLNQNYYLFSVLVNTNFFIKIILKIILLIKSNKIEIFLYMFHQTGQRKDL